jgi:hypothetical protein
VLVSETAGGGCVVSWVADTVASLPS